MKLDIMNEAIERCIDEMYRYAQPSITLKELQEIIKKETQETGEVPKVYERHYLSTEECKAIIDKYINAYNFEDKFKDHCDLIIQDMTKGCSKDKYIEGENGSPGYRGYEKVKPLSSEIGEENLNKVVEFIKMRKDFYKFDRKANTFLFNVWNISPYSNKEKVIEYWKSQGKDIEIKDRNKDDMWEVHEYGMTWEDWEEENKEYDE